VWFLITVGNQSGSPSHAPCGSRVRLTQEPPGGRHELPHTQRRRRLIDGTRPRMLTGGMNWREKARFLNIRPEKMPTSQPHWNGIRYRTKVTHERADEGVADPSSIKAGSGGSWL